MKAVVKEPGNKMNRSERKYAAHLEAERIAGRIQWWRREPISIRLAQDTRYVPDFLVINDAGELEVHEVKGSRGGANFHSRTHHHPHRDSWCKLKIAAEQFPARVWLVWPEGGEWKRKEVG